MILVVILPQEDGFVDIDFTLDGLRNQKLRNFDVVFSNPLNKFYVQQGYQSIQTPEGENNQLNAIVNLTEPKYDYYCIIVSGSKPNYEWLYRVNNRLDNPYISGRVHLVSYNLQPEDIVKPKSYKFGEVDSKDLISHNNFCFSYRAFKKHGGFNGVENTLKYFIAEHKSHYYDWFYVEKIIHIKEEKDFDLPYRFNTNERKFVQWKEVEESYPKHRENLLITFAFGDLFSEILTCTEGNMYDYADKINADYIQIRNNTQDWWGLNKFRLKNICKNYNRVLFIDADVWIQKHAQNIFDYVPDGYIGVYNDYKYNGDGTIKTNEWIKREAMHMCAQQGVEYIDSEIYNSGIVVFNGYQSDIWTPPPKPFIYYHCTEQHWFEQNIRRLGYKVKELGDEWNCQTWFKDFFKIKDKANFLHASGVNNKLYEVYEFLQEKTKIEYGKLINVNFKKIDVDKKKKYAIICVCSDNSQLIKETSKSHRAYARKVDADYHIITDNINPEFPMFNKYLISNYTSVYDKVLYVDSDVWIKWESPNIFELTPDDRISIHREDEEIKNISYHKHIQNTHDNICDALSVSRHPVISLNCGVMVIPKSCSHLYTHPKEKVPIHWCFDQHYLYINLYFNQHRHYEIGSKFNWEYINQNFLDGVPQAFFIHLNSIKSERKRLDILSKIINE